MNISKLTADLAVISKLPDSPTEAADSLKAKFDQASQAIGEYLNGVMVPQLNESVTAVEQTAGEANRLAHEAMQSVEALSDATGAVIDILINNKQDRISSGTSAPSGGSDGQIYIWY